MWGRPEGGWGNRERGAKVTLSACCSGLQNSNSSQEHRSPPTTAGMDRQVWALEDYTQLEKLHSGYASTVFRAKCRLSGRTVALKIYQPELLHEISR